MAVTQKDIAERLNISRSVVAHVLGNIPGRRVSAEVESRIRLTAREMNYRPNRAARMLSTGRSHVIGCWTHNPYTPYASRFLKNLESCLRADGYEMILSLPRFTETARDDNWPMDGLVVLDYHFFAAFRDKLSWKGPTVVLGIVEEADDIDSVGADLKSAAESTVRFLIARGYQKIAFVTFSTSTHGEARHGAYHRVMQEAGLKEEYILITENNRHKTQSSVQEYMEHHGAPEALFCISDEYVLPVYRALYNLGLKIPDDVAVIGFDDVEDAAYWEPPLTTTGFPVEQMVTKAWKYLKERIDDPLRPLQHCLLPAELVVRASVSVKSQRTPDTERIHGVG